MNAKSKDDALEVEGLRVEDRSGRAVLQDISFSLSRGDRLGVVGESGAGKTTLALSFLGHFRPGLRHVAGSIRVVSRDVLASSSRGLRDYRRTVVSYLGQDPAAALTPSLRVGDQVAELMLGKYDSESVRARLEAVGLPGAAHFAQRYPHEVSGGQLQRVAIARALAPNPAVLVLDEPTASMDIVTRRSITQEIERQADILGITLVLISHDLKTVAQATNRILVLRNGRVVEQGDIAETLSRPSHPYTSELVTAFDHARRVTGETSRPSNGTPALAIRGLTAGYGRRGRATRVVDGVDIDVHHGECVALIGTSGAGKTTIANCLLGLHEPDSGSVAVEGVNLAAHVRDRPIHVRRSIQFVPQDPQGSLNPRRRVGDTLCHAPRSMRGLNRSEANVEAQALIGRVRLSQSLLSRFPRELSGGERQRVAIARALAAEPRVLVCDEVTSALDVGAESSVLDLIDELRRERGMAVLLIAHDLRVVRRIADRAVVLHDGGICDHGTVSKVFDAPEHEFTRSILKADLPVSEILRGRLKTGA